MYLILAAIGKVVPCRKWGGWSGDGGGFERGVYGLVNARQVPAPKKVPVYTAVWNSLGFRSLISGAGAEQQKTMYHAVVMSLRYKTKPSTFGKGGGSFFPLPPEKKISVSADWDWPAGQKKTES
jgi:hypothetical protein